MATLKKSEGKNNGKATFSSLKSKEKVLRIAALLSIGLGAAILIYPFVPYLKYKLFPPAQDYVGQITTKSKEEKGSFSFLPIIGDKTNAEEQSGNRLIIPKIGVNTQIVEGQDDRALLKGAWRAPDSSTPKKGGNTVITGHRFRFRPPNNTTFYLLDQLGENDEIIVIWEGNEYRYKVNGTKVVNPDQTEILANTKEPILTLYTCTPIFTTKQRLVVISELI